MQPIHPVQGLHHVARRCRDAEQTRYFYQDIPRDRRTGYVDQRKVAPCGVNHESAQPPVLFALSELSELSALSALCAPVVPVVPVAAAMRADLETR